MKIWPGLPKWLYPGMRVKRWLLLASACAIGFGVGLLILMGKGTIGALYDWLNWGMVYYYLVGSILLLGGAIGIFYGLLKASKSVLEGLTTDPRATSDVIWQKRFLSKGPKVVAIGGGTGLSTLLKGLKQYTSNITAIVTVMDDGGSSGRLRREMNILPPGDIRNCIIALADDESRMGDVFQHRFQGGQGLEGHSLGNLIIAGMERMTGGFDRAIEETSQLLNIRGQVVPATLMNTNLIAEMEDGEEIIGESSLSHGSSRISKVKLADAAEAHPKAIEAIKNADKIVIGPGSLYTSIIPNLLVDGISDEIRKSRARKYYVVNIMTEPGETDDFDVSDHVNILKPYIDPRCFDEVIVNAGEISTEMLEQYAQDGAHKVELDFNGRFLENLKLVEADLVDVVNIDGKNTIKHAPHRLAELIIKPA